MAKSTRTSASPEGIQPFQEFLDELHAAGPEQHIGVRGSRIAHEDAFSEIRAHLLQHYQGAEAQHSFADENGSVFDCIPVSQQPALRHSREPVPTAPDLPRAPSRAVATDQRQAMRVQPLHPDRRDQHGNRMHAPDGTIPMRRLTIENLARFETLHQFFRKSPFGSALPPQASGAELGEASRGAALGGVNLRGADLRGADLRGADLRGADLRGADLRGTDLRGTDLRGAALGDADLAGNGLSAAPLAPSPVPPEIAATHRYAHSAQNVDNRGGHSYLNIWDPPIGANQIFSLSQHWYSGGIGAGLQTAEVGWQVYPQMYGNTKPVLFIYWTADAYQSTGCYNLTCSAFVQTNNAWPLGGAFSSWSTAGGQQYEIELAYFLSDGRWWLYINGEAGSDAIGYYPVSIYRNGALASGASGIDYGGEVVGSTSWPPMGSGAFANTGWQHAAYQKDIRYYLPGGGTTNASLIGSATSPQCYTQTFDSYNPPWNATLFFGGPGGSNC